MGNEIDLEQVKLNEVEVVSSPRGEQNKFVGYTGKSSDSQPRSENDPEAGKMFQPFTHPLRI